jgi:hypothetical protein
MSSMCRYLKKVNWIFIQILFESGTAMSDSTHNRTFSYNRLPLKTGGFEGKPIVTVYIYIIFIVK